jgi:hypothetical protein
MYAATSMTPGGAAMSENILQVRDLKKYFPSDRACSRLRAKEDRSRPSTVSALMLPAERLLALSANQAAARARFPDSFSGFAKPMKVKSYSRGIIF